MHGDWIQPENKYRGEQNLPEMLDLELFGVQILVSILIELSLATLSCLLCTKVLILA